MVCQWCRQPHCETNPCRMRLEAVVTLNHLLLGMGVQKPGTHIVYRAAATRAPRTGGDDGE